MLCRTPPCPVGWCLNMFVVSIIRGSLRLLLLSSSSHPIISTGKTWMCSTYAVATITSCYPTDTEGKLWHQAQRGTVTSIGCLNLAPCDPHWPSQLKRQNYPGDNFNICHGSISSWSSGSSSCCLFLSDCALPALCIFNLDITKGGALANFFWLFSSPSGFSTISTTFLLPIL